MDAEGGRAWGEGEEAAGAVGVDDEEEEEGSQGL